MNPPPLTLASRITFFAIVISQWSQWCPLASGEDAVAKAIAFVEKIDDIQIGYGLAIGDVDGDGKDDILLADQKEIVWYRNPDWQRHIVATRLSLKDNVCIAARDIDGDGKVEIAAGANWNPGETSNRDESGSVHYLTAPEDVTQPWTPVKLPHDPTTHRMHWVRDGKGKFSLVVLPLHGIDNRGGKGEHGVKVTAYHVPEKPEDAAQWKTTVLDDSMHMTHNFDLIIDPKGGADQLVIAGREGIVTLAWSESKWNRTFQGFDEGFGEVRRNGDITAGIHPFHGNKVTVALGNAIPLVLDESLNEGHALAIADLLGTGQRQIIAGWRGTDASGRVGIRLYAPPQSAGAPWTQHLIDDNTMACEDVKIADINGDGKPDIIAAGRNTKNLNIYWNRRK
ncbi:MAG: VCBS repeat-containing protein [Verrucomicrobia bacterium]|nr:VCBS repeat-containing protein [Verrucomicrobiota bacterium]